MRKFIIFITIALLQLCGCQNIEAPQDQEPEGYKRFAGDYYDDLVYTTFSGEYPRMAAADDGRMVVAFNKEKGTGVDFIEYALDGSSKKIGELNGYPEKMTFSGSELLYIRLKHPGIALYKVNCETGESEMTASFDNVPFNDTVDGMSGNKNEIYIIGNDSEKGDKECDYQFLPNYAQKRSVFVISGDKCEKLPVDFPTAVCALKSGGAVIAACDSEGFYITTYKNGELGEKIYTGKYNIDLDNIIEGIADVDGKHIVFSMRVFKGAKLYAAEISSMHFAEIMPDIYVWGSNIFSAGGLCYFIADGDQSDIERVNRIMRVDFSRYFKDNPPMDLITTNLSGNTAPFGCGYTININRYDYDEAALKILARDKDYDLCCVSTRDRISGSIRDKGSFYPLNDVPGVKEYLDKCFPAIREAFTDKNGDIWALPICADSDFIFKNSGEADFSKMLLSDFIDYIDSIPEDEMSDVSEGRDYTEDILKYYLAKNKSFDTSEFREAAEKIKSSERMNITKQRDRQGILNRERHLLTVSSYRYAANMLGDDFVISGLPGISETDIIVPVVTFLSVNPDSSHLSDVLGYIEKITEYQLTGPDNFVLSYENGAYTDVKAVRKMVELSENAPVYFTYPDELYWDDLKRYLSDELSLDSFIEEADRKLKIYLNE